MTYTQYRTAEQLDITAEEHAALVQLLTVLPAEQALLDTRLINGAAQHPTQGLSFNMGYEAHCAKEPHCGTVACIGGHVSFIMQGLSIVDRQVRIVEYNRSKAYEYVSSHRPDRYEDGDQTPLSDLYWPRPSIMDRAEPKHAVQAIHNFLTSGDPKWDDIAY